MPRWYGAILVALSLTTACSSHRGGAQRAAAPSHGVQNAQVVWSDVVVDASRDVVLRVSPRELVRDPVFGGILQRGLEAAVANARERGASAASLDTLAHAEDVVVAVRDREGRDVVAIVSGVPQGRAPDDLVDETGRPLFAELPRAPGARMRVFAGTALEQQARVFELPGATWVIGIGRGAERAESALTRAESLSYAPRAHAPAQVSFAGELLSSLKARAGVGLRPVARGLTSATMTLSKDPAAPTRARARLELAYADEPHAEGAEPTAARAAELLVTKLDFPVKPRVTRERANVAIELMIEARAN